MEQIGLLLDTHFLEADALRFSLMHRICSPYCIYNPSCYSFFSRPSISHPSQSSIPPCPICCTSRAVPVPKALALCPVHSRASLHIKYASSYLWQVHVRDNNLIQRAGGILLSPARVSARVVLIARILARLPRLRVLNLGHRILGGGGCWVARKMPACEAESAGHDC